MKKFKKLASNISNKLAPLTVVAELVGSHHQWWPVQLFFQVVVVVDRVEEQVGSEPVWPLGRVPSFAQEPRYVHSKASARVIEAEEGIKAPFFYLSATRV